MMRICIFEQSNEKNHFSKTKIYFHQKNTLQLLGHITKYESRRENEFWGLATVCLMHVDIGP